MLSTTRGTLDNWRYFGQLEVLSTNGGASTTRGTLDNRRYFGQLEVLWRTVGTPDKCPGQLEVLSMTGDPMMLCDHKVQSNPACVRRRILILTLTRADVGFELSLILQSELIC